MRFIYGKHDFSSMDRAQENCYLITNGLGGYSSMTLAGSAARNDHALFMACTKAPNHRYHMITRMDEILRIRGKEICLSTQEYVNRMKNMEGLVRLQQFRFEDYPVWIYQAEGIELKKTVVLLHGANTIGIRYEIENRTEDQVSLSITPQLQFVQKGESITQNQSFEVTDEAILSNGMKLFYQSNVSAQAYDTRYQEDLYYSYDARDGRDAIGKTAHNHCFTITVLSKQEGTLELVYRMEKEEKISFDQILLTEEKRHKAVELQSGLTDEVGLHLVKSADQFIVHRDSTDGKSVMAGYPFFADWGRDTMIAMVGLCIPTGRFDDAKSIFRTFMKYCSRGLMPNLFPEGENEPWYNTVDAALLFIGAVYEYYLESSDLEFVREAYPVMKDIIAWYRKGTDFHIRMEEDALIAAGNGLEQVTWMDVRFGDILPTPRHGKPVEINAYWYNDLRIMSYFGNLLGVLDGSYDALAEQVKLSFCKKFWNEKEGCLKDLVSGEAADDQIRCNQIWAISLPFTMLSREQEIKVVDKVFEKLYTPYGLRTLNPDDKDFKPIYGGSHFHRDMAYHQGTVWPFPLGGYYLAYLKVNDYSSAAVCKVREQLAVMEACLREGCVGQIAEIYDGGNPSISQGCFAQAWSVSEILRVYAKLEKLNG